MKQKAQFERNLATPGLPLHLPEAYSIFQVPTVTLGTAFLELVPWDMT